VKSELHRWNVSYAEARRIQNELAGRVRLAPLPEKIRLVAGTDMSLSKADGMFFAAAVVLSLPNLEMVEERTFRAPGVFPYVPGLLSFREGPVVLEALRRLSTRPDVVIFDGQGIAHPRRLGLASHMGLWLDLPSVGCAKSRLVGEHEEPPSQKGAWVPLTEEGLQIGSVLRTRAGVKPLFVSPGHLCDHEGARRIVLDCCSRYRMPEPTRLAHLAVGRARRAWAGE